jgi:hypothetical protein
VGDVDDARTGLTSFRKDQRHAIDGFAAAGQGKRSFEVFVLKIDKNDRAGGEVDWWLVESRHLQKRLGWHG